jgi:uncharacterized protein YecE (DUF72 family)
VAGRIVVGTSSWADPGFVADWYPPALAASEQLPFYAERFEAVELNSSFYALPHADAAARWARVTPSGFSFDVKLHRLLSRHAAGPESLPADLRAGVETTARGRVVLTPRLEAAIVERLVEGIAPLERAGKLKAFLLQLSPAFSPRASDLHELDSLLGRLAPHCVAVEFRHRGWVEERRLRDTLTYLSDRGATFVCVDAPAGDQVTILPPLDAVTADRLAYFRAHGRNLRGYVSGRSVPERFGWRYSDDELQQIRRRVETLADQASEVRVMFNNNRSADAPLAATRLRELLGQEREAAPERRRDLIRSR